MSDSLNDFGQTRINQKQADLAAHLMLMMAKSADDQEDTQEFIDEVTRVYDNIEHNARLVKESLQRGLPDDKK